VSCGLSFRLNDDAVGIVVGQSLPVGHLDIRVPAPLPSEVGVQSAGRQLLAEALPFRRGFGLSGVKG
jgi:hypothetical protein